VGDELFDAIVIGAGNAGLAAAGVLRGAGRTVLVIEARELGGTCPLRGCVPKKVLVAAAEALDTIARAAELGIRVDGVHADWSRVIDRQTAIIAGTSEAIEGDLVRRGVTLVRGAARFIGPDRVAVADRVASAGRVLIATGSRPRPLTLPGGDLVTMSDALLTLRAPPRSLVFIGAGVIAFELGHVFARLGTRVTMLEVAPRPLGMIDQDAVAELVRASAEIGITLHTGVTLECIVQTDEGLRVDYGVDGTRQSVIAERVGHGAGRVADLDGLDLAAGEVRVERGAVVIGSASGAGASPFQSVSNARVFVAGDALAGTPQLSPVATYEGRLVARAMLGEEVNADYTALPSCVFSVPTLASVGLSEAAAKARGMAPEVKLNDMTSWRSGRTYAERHAWAKVLVLDDRIIGAHLVGHGAAETIHPLALAMKHGIRASELKDFVWAYPSFSSDLKYLL